MVLIASRSTRCLLRHRIARSSAKFAFGWTVHNIPCGFVETMSRFGTEQDAPLVASFLRSRFERDQQCPTDPTEPSVWRDIIQRYLARVGHASHCQNGVALDGDQDRVARFANPGRNSLGSLVGEPPPEDHRIIPVIGSAQFGNRSPEHLASGRSIFGNGVADLHATASCGQGSLPKPSARSLSPTAASPAAEIVVVVLPGFRV